MDLIQNNAAMTADLHQMIEKASPVEGNTTYVKCNVFENLSIGFNVLSH